MSFFDSAVLTKRGPLARVWMASHLSSKLSKSHLLAVSVPSSVQQILGDVALPGSQAAIGGFMALRLSGQLLLGVTRIYGRKAKYLLDDCQDVLGRVKRAFRPGQVDLDETAQAGGQAGAAAITLQADSGNLLDIDAGANYWDLDFAAAGPVASTSNNAVASTSKNVANLDDITLHAAADEYGAAAGGFDDLGLGMDGMGLDLMAGGWGEEGLELDLEMFTHEADAAVETPSKKRRRDGEEDGDDQSVELGRDAPGSEARLSAAGIADGMDIDLGEYVNDKFDYGDIGAGGGFGGEDGEWEIPHDPGVDYGNASLPPPSRQGTPRAASVVPSESIQMTPRTAAALAANKTPVAKKTAAAAAGAEGEPSAKKPKLKKVVLDKEIEVSKTSKEAKEREKENLFTEPRFLPKSRLHLRLLEISNDPTAYFLPNASTSAKGKDATINFAPAGLAPELAQMFDFPAATYGGVAAPVATQEEEDDLDVELGRDRQASEAGGYQAEKFDYGDIGAGGGFGGDDFDGGDAFENPFENVENEVYIGKDTAFMPEETPRGSKGKGRARRTASLELEGSVIESQAPKVLSKGALRVFDTPRASKGWGASTTVAGSPSKGGVTHSLDEVEEEETLGEDGSEGSLSLSKNTVKAVEVLRTELKEEGGTVEFGTLAAEATRRAAAAMFHEILLLKTKDVIKVRQTSAFEAIEVEAKEALFSADLVATASVSA